MNFLTHLHFSWLVSLIFKSDGFLVNTLVPCSSKDLFVKTELNNGGSVWTWNSATRKNYIVILRDKTPTAILDVEYIMSMLWLEIVSFQY